MKTGKYYLFSTEANAGKHYIHEDGGACYHREDGAFFETIKDAELFAEALYPRDTPNLWEYELSIRSL